jgi:DNA topoisomerase IB
VWPAVDRGRTRVQQTVVVLDRRTRVPRLRRVSCAGPGITRRKRGRGFEYLDETGAHIDDPETLQRIKDLAIPPAWTDVWICPHTNGHLQAVGTDAADRKQYIYHQVWRERRDQEKFSRMLAFARSLKDVRRITDKHLAESELDRDRVLACAVRLLDFGFFRIGGEAYAESNESFGLATLRKDHVTLEGREVVFEYMAKSKRERLQSVVDPQVFEVVKALKRRRSGGEDLLAYKINGEWHDVKSSEINTYLKEIAGDEFSAKDFRTWHATVIAARALAVSRDALRSKTARKRAVSRAIEEAAHYLGNTPAVCRASYVDPRVIDRYESRWTIWPAIEKLADEDFEEPAWRETFEDAVLDLLEERRSDLVERVDRAVALAS